MSNRTVSISIRLRPEENARLEAAAKKVKLSKHSLAQESVMAGITAIEANEGRLALPIEFEVTHVSVPKSSSSPSPSHRSEHTSAEEKPNKKSKAA